MVTLKQTPTLATGFAAWLQSLPVRWPDAQAAVVQRAYALATARGLAVADLLADLRMDHEVIVAALLHETVAQQRYTAQDLAADFGPNIAQLIDAVTKLELIGTLHRQGARADEQLESLRKMLLAMAQDVRAVLLKLAIHLTQLRELDGLPREAQQRFAEETLDIFAPLANRLGMGRIKWELEDRALRYLEPEVYKQLAKALDERRVERERYIAAVVAQLQGELQRAGVNNAQVSGRVKHIYSIWRKMQRKRLPFEQIFDVRAVRIMVGSVADCYAALGVVHALWKHIRKEFDDYIANPKNNGYRSLHTAVVGPDGKTLEVQIRTQEMHQNAELGVAAHWRYKEGGRGQGNTFEQQIAWLRQLLEWKDDAGNAGDFWERFSTEAFQDRVYVITPKGAVLELAQGATPLDFAYHVHTEVGHRCRGAKVDGRIVPLTHELKNGEQVEVLTTKNGTPSRDWLNPHAGYLKTSRARGKVRQWFRQQDLDKSIAAGRATLEREFQRLGVDSKQVDLTQVAGQLNYTRPDELLAAIGYGDIATGQVLNKIQALILPPQPADGLRISQKSRPERDQGITVRGVGNLLTHMARCCQPAPFDPIVGFVTKGRGVAIHRQNCANVLKLADRHRQRLIEVEWGRGNTARYPVDIFLEGYDRPGLLRDITSELVKEQINVTASSSKSEPDTGLARMQLTLEVADVEQLSRVLAKLAKVPNVIQAYRQH